MFKNIIKNFKELDKLTISIMKKGIIFCAILALVALSILITYNLSFTIPILFTAGFILLKLSLTFAVEFIICGFVVDKIKAGVI